MTKMMKMSLLMAGLVLGSFSASTAQVVVENKKREGVKWDKRKSLKDAGIKAPFIFTKKDTVLTIGGRIKPEFFYQPNISMLNSQIPDASQYIKTSIDLTFDVAYGQKKYDYKAVEAFLDLRHKGVFGKALSYFDRDAGAAVGPSLIRVDDGESAFGIHTHSSGKLMLWFNEAWLKFSPNAAFSTSDKNLHTFQVGWFPFQLGRGIALGTFYGTAREYLGLYSYKEDNSAPGANLHGNIIKDMLDYDIYYSRLEERGKGIRDTFNIEKKNVLGLKHPWRGVAKNAEVIAGRIQYKPFSSNETIGTLMLEPYAFYNVADDRKVELYPDSKGKWGSYGLMLEHEYKDFEWGAEVAFNYGKQDVVAIDRNEAVMIADVNGYAREVYSYVYDDKLLAALPVGGDKKLARAAVTPAAYQAVWQDTKENGKKILDPKGNPTGYTSADNRFKPAYKNTFDGWMGVVDAAYNIKAWDLKVSLAYGYVSGDKNPNFVEKDKDYKGFIGLHENYVGKRVPSILILDERFLRRPVNIDQAPRSRTELVFSDMQFVGGGLAWEPKKSCIKDLYINPNVIAFWKTHGEPKYDAVVGKASTTEMSSDFLGTEINLFTECSVVKDLMFFVNLAAFVPGQFFKDVKGLPLDKDFFDFVLEDQRNDIMPGDTAMFGLGTDTAYHVNVGFEYRF